MVTATATIYDVKTHDQFMTDWDDGEGFWRGGKASKLEVVAIVALVIIVIVVLFG